MVVVQSGFVNVVVGAIRKHSGPGYREAIVGHPQLLQHLHILVNLVVTVTSNIGILTVVCSQRGVGKLVPDAQSLSVGSPAPFNLK